ncbi:MAG: YjcZ family sporulation protein [Erysipelotrichaceae bacterium]|nr:YjcZ family sporulation protein [Erysipelotrichaceae bacterium]MBQ9986941.1 YjcZ family sporulation protein [Erysipelotrichales bacterium]MBR3693006.1 YjcZ family sporulation protein [Erysipelotrichales bacterium]
MSNCNSQGCGSGFVVCLVLFILLVIIGCICF